MRYDREPDAITVACRVTAHIRSSTRALQALLWMGLVFSRESHFAQTSIGERGAKNSSPIIVICPALTFFLK
jgi:hypothetical protein